MPWRVPRRWWCGCDGSGVRRRRVRGRRGWRGGVGCGCTSSPTGRWRSRGRRGPSRGRRACQAPGFMEALLVGSGGGRLWLFLVVGVGDPGGLVLGRGAHADGAVGTHRVVPVDPLGGGELDIVDALPGALVADELGLVQGVEGLGQSEAERSPPSTRRMRPPRTGPGSARNGWPGTPPRGRSGGPGPVRSAPSRRRAQTAISRAPAARSAYRLVEVRRPMTRRE